MVHYIYKIIFLCGKIKGRYYIGKRSYKRSDPYKDNFYKGSGLFCERYYKKYGAILNVTYTKEIIEINETFDKNRDREKEIIGDLYKTDKLCVNIIPGGFCPREMAMLSHSKKSIVQYSLDGEIIKEYESVTAAAEAMGIYRSGIIAAANGKQVVAADYIWRYKGDSFNKFSTVPYKSYCIKGRPVVCINIIDGTRKEYDKVVSAARDIGVTTTTIRRYILNGEIMWNKYKWEYKWQ